MKVVGRVYARLLSRYVRQPAERAPSEHSIPMRCPTCEAVYGDDTDFCSRDGTRLLPDASVAGDPFIGQVIDGRYRVDGVLGRGGMGVVYRAHQVNVDRAVAVKVLNHDASGRPEVVRRFENEARIISKLRHPNTLKLIDFGHLPDGRLFIINPLLEGLPLDEVLKREGRLPLSRTLMIVREVALALAEAHDHGVVHRDLKPANIFTERLGRQEVVKVLDFGIAKLTHETTQITQENTTIGTVPYMSPEQVRAEQIDARSDLYSLGCVAYECLVGRPPFGGESFLSVAMKHLNDDPPPLREAVPPLPGLDAAVEELVLRCLEKLPDDRPPDAMALVKAVQRIERRLAQGVEGDASPFVTLPPTAALGAISGEEPTVDAPTPLSGQDPVPPRGPSSTDRAVDAPRPARRRVLVVLGLLLTGAAAAAVLLTRASAPSSAPDAAVTAASVASPPDAAPALTAALGPDAARPSADAAPDPVDAGAAPIADAARPAKPAVSRRRWRPRPAVPVATPTPPPTSIPAAAAKPAEDSKAPPGLW